MYSKTLTLNSTTIFLKSLETLSLQSPQFSPPLSASLLSDRRPLPPLPSDFPHSKFIPKTRFIVDGFRHAGDYSVSYFLSHFHSDHYTGLTPNWCKGVIFCSQTTSRLLAEVLKVPASLVVPLSISETLLIDGCEVSLVDANHCPGAVQFLFKVPYSDGKVEKYVHTGDFRYCHSMKDTFLSDFVGADSVFLDTTYCNPKFVFPSQDESIDYIVSVIERIRVENEDSLRSVLFLVATYVIGKERILQEIYRRCNKKILVDRRKMSILRILGFGEVEGFTEEESESNVHVVGWNVLGETWPYFRPNFVKMKEIMNEKGYSKVVGFVPTGWTYEVKRNKFSVRMKDSFEIHLVPYSEHSNYSELREYVRFLRPKRVIPTVGADMERLDGKISCKMQKHFSGLVDEMAIKQDFLLGFQLSVRKVDEKVQDCGIVLSDESDYSDIVRELPELKPVSQNVPGNAELYLHCQKKPSSQNPKMLNEIEIGSEDHLQQLQNCLPAWITRKQMLNLLSSSDGNVVEAVSNFYEQETRLYEEVHASTSSCMPEAASACESELSFIKNFNRSADASSLSQSSKLCSIKHSATSSISPRKRRKNQEAKSVKRERKNLTLNSSGPRQSSITRFFHKVAPTTSASSEDGTVLKQSHNYENILPNNPINVYEDEVNQFLQIVNGGETLRSYAATVLQESKGDIGMAVDVYFSSPHITSIDNAVCSEGGKLLQTQGEPASDENNKGAEQLGNIAVTSVSLPLEKYFPIEHACWRHGQPAPYVHLARTFELVEKEKGKRKATSMLCNMFRSLLALSPMDVLPALYLCTNKIAPDHENMELNVGGRMIVSALEEVCGTNRSKVRELYQSLGDLGDVAQLCRQTQSLLAPPAALSIQGMFSVLRKISVQTGSGSTARKKNLIVNLMRSCREKEMKFLVRTLVRNLRIGAMLRTVLPALAHAVVMNAASGDETLENLQEQFQCLSAAVVEAYDILPSLDLLIPALMNKGAQFSTTMLAMVPGIPIKPMLAKITNGISQVLKLLQNKAFTCEYKYDGQRVQIHRLADGSVHVFSRNGDETTSRFPDLLNIIKKLCNPSIKTFILDTEVVAVDRKNCNKLMSFQELSSRERGGKDSSISVNSIKVDICVFAFDVMLANGEQLLGFSLRERRKYLKNIFGEEKLGYFEYAKETTVEEVDASASNEATLAKMNSFLDDAIQSSCEGIMVKCLDVDAGYMPSKRSDSWLKVKQDYVDGLSDCLDLVPIGAWYGNGRKAGWYSPFLMACYNPEAEEFQSVCRVLSGFEDSFYKKMKEFFSGDKILSKKPPYYQTAEVPNIWFSAELVWEIKGADFTVSPVHHAAFGLIHPSRGISIRFPRFIRSIEDRNPEECSTGIDIAEMFQAQTRKTNINVKQ